MSSLPFFLAVRQALERLAISLIGYVKGRDLEDILKHIWLAHKAGPLA